jgi:hypothetical protein
MPLTRRPRPLVFVVLAFVLSCSLLGTTGKPSSAAAAAEPVQVSATLAGTPEFDGLSAWPGDGSREPRVLTKDGRECWSTDKATDRLFVYADIDDDLIHDGEHYVSVTVDYFDEGGGTFTLVYDGVDGFDLEHPDAVEVGTTQTWKQHTFEVERAKFANRLNDADFRLAIWAPSFGHSPADVCFAKVELVDTGLPTHDLRIEQTVPGNVFAHGQVPRFTAITVGTSIRWTAYDAYGRPVAQGVAPTPEGTAEIAVPLEANGYYELAVRAFDGDELVRQRRAAFAMLPPELDLDPVEESPFGMSAHLSRGGWNPEILAPLARKAGVKNIRDEIEWRTVELEHGSYDIPAGGQAYMDELAKAGIDPFIIFSYNNPLYDDNVTPHTDEGIDAFARYGQHLVRHFGDQLDQVEVYNEYNIPNFSTGPCSQRADCYVRMLERSYQRVKEIRPDVTVVGAATSGIPMEWLEEVFALGGLRYMDAVSVHPYRYPRAPEGIDEEIAALDALIKRYNGGKAKPIWITELGWPTHVGGSGVDENTQASYLARAQVVALSAGVRKFFWYDLMNDGIDPAYNENNFGIIRNPADPLGRYTPKPAYVSEATLTRQLTGATYVDRDDVTGDAAGDVWSYHFRRGRTDVRALWSDTPRDLTLTTRHPVTVTDLWGNATTLRPHRGKVYLTATAAPVYVRGPVTALTDDAVVGIHASSERVVVGEPVPMTLEVDNTAARAPLRAEFTLEGHHYDVVAPTGQQATRQVALEEPHDTGTLPYEGVVRTEVSVIPPVELAVQPRLGPGGEQSLRIEVRNNSSTRNQTLTALDWSFGEQSGTDDAAREVAPGESAVSDVALDPVPLWEVQPVEVSARLEGADPVVHTGRTGFAPAAGHSLEVDGDTSELAEVSGIDLTAHGENLVDGWEGPADLSGTVWATWDDDHVFLAARLTDDTFAQDAIGGETWKGDGLQFAVARGLPGQSTDWYEYGIALTPDGPQVYRWIAPPGVPTGPVTGAALEVVRDDEGHVTSYELALPWSELAPVTADDRQLSLSLLVNDNDGAGRTGWIQWGSGIGTTKDPGQFRAVQLVDAAGVSP